MTEPISRPSYTQPEIVSGVTKLDKEFFDNLLEGLRGGAQVAFQMTPGGPWMNFPMADLLSMLWQQMTLNNQKQVVLYTGQLGVELPGNTLAKNVVVCTEASYPPDPMYANDNTLYIVRKADGSCDLRIPKIVPVEE
ncbi:hypothetical protein SEA_MACGULLY_44 [Rhodococcus phage MacGully]|nr:hypothetical protein SEA_MACGULLY_44 [Rhodococcus phage MacGully]